MTATKKDLLDILVELKSVSQSEAQFLRRRYPAVGELAAVLLQKGVVSEINLAKAFTLAYQLPFIHLTGKQIDEKTLKIIPYQLASKYQMIAYEFSGNVLKIAAGQPAWLRPAAGGPLHNLANTAHLKVEIAITTPRDIAWALGGYHRTNLKSGLPVKAPAVGHSAIPNIDLKNLTIPLTVLNKFPADVARKYQMVVFEAPSERHFKVAAVNPANPKLVEIVKFLRERNEIEIELYQTDNHGFEKVMLGYDKKPTRQIERFGAGAGIAGPLPSPLGNGSPASAAARPQPLSSGQAVVPTGAGVITENDFDQMLNRPPQTREELETIIKSGFVPKIVAGFVAFATKLKASDIHLEPSEKDFRARFRLDGVLQEVAIMPLALQPPVISRVKILSKMKIDEQRIPQDGRFDVKVLGHEVDIRVSSLPTVHGEKVAMRLLDKSAARYTLEDIGLTGRNMERMKQAIAKPWGIIFVTGPTGSGKTTTLYATLNRLLTPKINVITLEDPVEYDMPGVNQTQVKPKIGFTFAEGLRSVLRQDPNVIMVGEVRDGETASLTTHAALTGHLVLSTLHTNNAAGALPRLINMGIEAFLLTSAINAIVGQRLVRKLCATCRKETKLAEKLLEQIKQETANLEEAKTASFTFYEAVGCSECTNGYSGRLGLFEVLNMSPRIEELAINRQSADAIEQAAIKEGMMTMRQDGILKAMQGLTTLEEVYKVTEQ